MPKRNHDDDEMPARKRGARAAAIEREPGVLMRMLLENPKDVVAGLLAFAAVSAILTNALFLQSGPHPAPMFGALVPPAAVAAVSPLPRPRPAEARVAPAEPVRAAEPRHVDLRSAEPRAAEPRIVEPRPVEPKPEIRPVERNPDPLASLVKATTATPSATPVVRPPAPIPAQRAETAQSVQARRVLAVQRALSDNGFGQLKLNGTLDADTRAAIQNFERRNGMTPTGQLSDRLLAALTRVTGRPIE